MRYLLLMFLLFITTNFAEARYCNSPSCSMCNSLFGPMPGYNPNSVPYSRRYGGRPDFSYQKNTPQVFQYQRPQQPQRPQQSQSGLVLSLQPPKPLPQTKYEQASTESISTPSSPLKYLVDKLLYLEKGDKFCDIGCGDGKVLIAAAQKFKAKIVGIELNKTTASMTRERIAQRGLDITVHTGNAMNFDFSSATVVYIYLYPPEIAKLIPKLRKELRPGARVISLNHKMPGVRQITYKGEGSKFYIWFKTLAE